MKIKCAVPMVGTINEIAVADDAAFGRNRLEQIGRRRPGGQCAWPEADVGSVSDEVVLPVQVGKNAVKFPCRNRPRP